MFRTPTSFSENVERVAEEKGIPLYEAVVWYCEQHGMEVEAAARLVTPTLRERIAAEARSLHLVE